MRLIGTTSRGIRLPIITEGDDIVRIVVDQVIEASQSSYEPFKIRDRDVVGITESLLARAQGNYVTSEDIAADVRAQIPSGDVVLLAPLLSRNRFYPLLKGIIAGVSGKVHILLTYPNDEVGNQLINPENFYTHQSRLSGECFGEEEFYSVFGEYLHPFTGVDYIKLYKGIAPDRVQVHFSNNPLRCFDFADNVIVSTIHMRGLHKSLLRAKSPKGVVIGLDDICKSPIREGAGYNELYGLLGANNTGEDRVKLFPRGCEEFVEAVRKGLLEKTGKNLEVLIYGDGAFKDPVCGIWELADPVVSPAFTAGLYGVPKEIKLKYIADNSEGDAGAAVMDAIRDKAVSDQPDGDAALGTTPRRFADLVGSLCDLTSGSGDKGTPVVYISGYFDNYTDN